MKASDLFVKALENEGVEYIFGIPGEENLDLLESLRESKIKLIVTRHEQAAGFMAATYGRLTGKAGVCLSTLGPGATNLVTPAAYAQLGAMPMMMITGQKPIMKSKQGSFQIVNIVEMMRPLTKFTKQIVNGNTIPALIRKSFKIAEEERPGAVHLELPEDIANEDTDTPLLDRSKIRRPIAEEKAIKKAVEMNALGATIKAGEAHRIGLVNQVYPVESFEQEVEAYLDGIRKLSRPVVRLAKRSTVLVAREQILAHLERTESIYLDELMKLSDAGEGIEAFMARREPVWTHA
ncbi:MAG: hypothetical protein IIC02_02125 [Planctomycetes bacterium]|nr:hypothetical protein [Planctomycetota bacterium]